ncbi:hypothetical protein E2542_SST22237 [Spatholobus suberectus]|nr:hypothetical protein E2542_SST22237 [Spatholobus suberectus]
MRSRNTELNDDRKIEAKGVGKWIGKGENVPAKRLRFRDLKRKRHVGEGGTPVSVVITSNSPLLPSRCDIAQIASHSKNAKWPFRIFIVFLSRTTARQVVAVARLSFRKPLSHFRLV